MAKYNEKFNRIEKKYLLKRNQAIDLINLIKDQTEKDDYYKYSVYNLYYDTVDSQMIQNSLQKPVYKEKLRLRSYGEVNDDSKVFVEMKKKFQNTVFKRRIGLKMNEAIAYLDNHQSISDNSQIKKEIDYMLEIYNPVKKLYLAYDRIAYHGKENNEIRITFDRNIRYRFDDLILKDSDHDLRLLDDDEFLMEIKVQDAYPLWLSKALNTLKIYPTSFSKYGKIYLKSIEVKKEYKEVIKEYKAYGFKERMVLNV